MPTKDRRKIICCANNTIDEVTIESLEIKELQSASNVIVSMFTECVEMTKA